MGCPFLGCINAVEAMRRAPGGDGSAAVLTEQGQRQAK